jgi:hypothetical protein
VPGARRRRVAGIEGKIMARQNLGKWPTIVVAGEPVTTRQAQHILIRCRSWMMEYSNTPGWIKSVHQLARDEIGYPIEPDARDDVYGGDHDAFFADWARRWRPEYDAWCERYGVLGWISADKLECDLIASTYHSWCWPDGMIAGQFGIGKEPGEEEIREDWEAIAAQFPWLTLTAHLVPEGLSTYTEAYQYQIADGRVEMTYGPCEVLQHPEGFDRWWNLGRWERSALSLDEIRAALRAVAEDM